MEITIKVTNEKGIIIGRSVMLFNKARTAVGFWNNSIVFATTNPKTMPDCQVLIYTISELKETYEEGNLQGLVAIE